MDSDQPLVYISKMAFQKFKFNLGYSVDTNVDRKTMLELPINCMYSKCIPDKPDEIGNACSTRIQNTVS